MHTFTRERPIKLAKKTKILFIDDDEMMKIYFRDIFWVHGRSDAYDIVIASSFDEAEKMIEEGAHPDVIYMDVMVSLKTGKNSPDERIKRSLEFVKKIKHNKSLHHTKIIIFSGQKEKLIEYEFHELGIDGYLVKGELMPKEIISFTDNLNGLNH
ncbi:MAG TPA: response regulator [Candidatus Paceibacterota bacterium]|nr:response regulator [Candidatus Paceibacterota bacterium]